MGSLPSSMWRLLCCCRAGIVTLIAMVLSSLMSRCLCSPGIFAIITIMLLPSLQCSCCHRQAGVVILVTMASSSLSLRRHLCHCHDGVIALVALVPLPTLHGRYPPCCTGIIVIIPLTSLPSLCMGIVTVVAPTLLPPSSWHVCAIECGYNKLRLLLYANSQHIWAPYQCAQTLCKCLRWMGEAV
jgi:hypothetical protein